MNVGRTAVQQQESSLFGIAAPVQVVKLQAVDFYEPAGRLRPYGSRLLSCLVALSYCTRGFEHRTLALAGRALRVITRRYNLSSFD